MRTLQSRNTVRGHGRRDLDDMERDEFNTSGMEDSWRNEDFYYYDRDEDRPGFRNSDYDEDNYWSGDNAGRESWQGRDNNYVPSNDRDFDRFHSPDRTDYGSGGYRSAQIRDFDRWRAGNEPEGYQGRNSNDYRNGYGNGRYYDPSEGQRQGNYRDDYQNEYEYHQRGHGRADESYGDYQSYPAYGARGYRSGEYDPSRSERFRNGGDADREYGRPHRPFIREKRY